MNNDAYKQQQLRQKTTVAIHVSPRQSLIKKVYYCYYCYCYCYYYYYY